MDIGILGLVILGWELMCVFSNLFFKFKLVLGGYLWVLLEVKEWFLLEN